jgi:3-mercaptopyruvate sulfurtransferase SseA
MHLPTAKRDARAEYLVEHIPGALFFDIDDIADEKVAAAAHAAVLHQVRQPHEEDGHRRRHARRRLRQRGPIFGGARVVDVPRHGP